MIQKMRVHFIYVFYILFFLFMLHRLSFFSVGILEKTTSYICYPFLKIKSAIVYPFEKVSLYATDQQVLHRQIRDLMQQNQDLQAELIQKEALQTFNEQIKEIREFAKRYDYQHKKLGAVLLTDCSEKEDTIMVDLGSDHQVKKDDIVVFKNILIGRVVEVYPWYCKVALITDQRCKVSAKCRKNVTGICCGKNNNQLEFNFVPHFKDVQVGDSLISTGKGLMYPQGFALGTVTSIESDNVSHYITVKPMVDVQDIDHVYICSK